MTKIPNWSRADEEYSNPKVIMGWEHDQRTQRVFIEKRKSRRQNSTFYTIQEQNFPDGFDGHGYIEEAENATQDTRDDAIEVAREQLKRNPDGITISKLDIGVEDLPMRQPE